MFLLKKAKLFVDIFWVGILSVSLFFVLYDVVTPLVYRLPIEGNVGELIKIAMSYEIVAIPYALLFEVMKEERFGEAGFWEKVRKNFLKEMRMSKWILFAFVVDFFGNILLFSLFVFSTVCMIVIFKIPFESVFILVYTVLVAGITLFADFSLARRIRRKAVVSAQSQAGQMGLHP